MARSRPLELQAGDDPVRQGEAVAARFIIIEGALEVWKCPLAHSHAAVLQEIWRDDLAPRLRGNPALADRFAERLADRRLTDARRAGPRTGTADPQERQPGIAALLRRARQWLALAEAAPQGH